jgi:transposase
MPIAQGALASAVEFRSDKRDPESRRAAALAVLESLKEIEPKIAGDARRQSPALCALSDRVHQGGSHGALRSLISPNSKALASAFA